MPHPTTHPLASPASPDASASPARPASRFLRPPRLAAVAALTACVLSLACGGGDASAGAETPPTDQPCATLPSGAQVCGAVDTVKVATISTYPRVYRGIPYASAPVGATNRRWMPPQDTTLSGRIDATRFGRVCPQGKAPADTTRMSESCLFLNVWSPAAATVAKPVPVMVFIHGGAFVMGSGSSGLYRGAYMAAADTVVVVTLNYRLGALGFLYGGTSAGTAIHGNLGLMDQQKAMQWVRRNIGAFGGDSSRVTIFGESAGAMSVGFHLFSVPTSDSLFRAAIMESNPAAVPYRTPALASGDGDRYVKALCGASHRAGVDCALGAAKWFDANAQTASLDEVLAAQTTFDGGTHAAERLLAGGLVQGLPWTPVVEDSLVRGQPVNGYASAMPRAKPFVFGTNRDEGVLFADAGAKDLTPLIYGQVLVRVFGDSAADSIRAFTDANGKQPYRAEADSSDYGMNATASAFSRVLTDFLFACGNLAAADSALAKQAGKPVYGYRFQRSPVPVQMYDPDTIPACRSATGAVCHGDELPYVFNTLSYADTLNGNTMKPADADLALSVQMAYLWGFFAKNLTMPDAVKWTPYTKNGSVYTFGALPPNWAGFPAAAHCPRPWSNIYPLGPMGSRSAARTGAPPAEWGRMPAAPSAAPAAVRP